MNRGNLEGDTADLAISEIEQAFLQSGFVEVVPLLAPGFSPDPHAGMAAEIVELAQSAFGQQIVDEKAALAAKRFVVFDQAGIVARFAAVETRRRFLGFCRGIESHASQGWLWRIRQTAFKKCAHASICASQGLSTLSGAGPSTNASVSEPLAMRLPPTVAST